MHIKFGYVNKVSRINFQENSYTKTLRRDDNNKQIRCRATNPYFDEINAVLMDPRNGYSDVQLFSVQCKYMRLKLLILSVYFHYCCCFHFGNETK